MTAATIYVKPITILDMASLVSGVTAVVADPEAAQAARDVKRDARALRESTTKLCKSVARAWASGRRPPQGMLV